MLFLLGSTAAGTLIGCRGEAAPELSAGQPGGAVTGCVITPQQTEGPYFVDERLQRSDIRADPETGIVKGGVPLAVTLHISQARSGGCEPLAGALVDVWHCDALGAYSDVRDRTFDTVGQKFLRGYQLTDDSGAVTFQTIYPGWYSGRAVHIHFKVRTSPGERRGRELTSQLYFDEGITDRVHARAPYAGKGRRDTRNATDGIYRRGGSQLVLPVTPQGEGYHGAFDIALQA
jgi:protocatechuate 3,4-dioxygenase beta subunit